MGLGRAGAARARARTGARAEAQQCEWHVDVSMPIA